MGSTRGRWCAVAIVALLAADGAVLAVRHDDSSQAGPGAVAGPPAPTVTVPDTTTTTAAPQPVELWFTRQVNHAAKHEAFAVRPDGTALRPLPGVPNLPGPQVRADGRMVFSKRFDVQDTTFRPAWEAGIVTSAADGSDEQVLTKGGYDTLPSWSPDGTQILFRSHVKLKGEQTDAVAIMNADGTGTRLIELPKGGNDNWPAWSPDGRSIAVVRAVPKVDYFVTVVPLDGSPPRQLAAGIFEDLAFSHDGRFIAAMKRRNVPQPGTSPATTGMDLWVVPVDGSPARPLTRVAESKPLYRHWCGSSGGVIPTMHSPRWSQDDSRIAFLSTHRHVDQFAHVRDVLVVNADGTGLGVARATPPIPCRGGQPGWPGEHVQLLRWAP